MSLRSHIPKLLIASGVIAITLTAFFARQFWYPTVQKLLAKKAEPKVAEQEDNADHHGGDRIKLTEQAQKTLHLDVRPVQLQKKYWRSIQIPAHIVERTGRSHQGVTSTLPGVVTEVIKVPGEVVEPGEKLFTVRVISEHLQASQRELFKLIREEGINREEKERLKKLKGAIPEIELLKLDYEYRRLQAKETSYRFELSARGLGEEQIEKIAKGDFIKEVTIRAPVTSATEKASVNLGNAPPPITTLGKNLLFSLDELKVHRGDQVQAGETLCVISEHQFLFVEGHAFTTELPLLYRAMQEEWEVTLDLPPEESPGWSPVPAPLKILYIGDKVDQESQTLPVFVLLPNQHHERTEDNRRFRTWRFRPSQRVFLNIRVEELNNVFVLPREAVVSEGAEHYVFRQNGDVFERKAVQVRYQDQRNVVIAEKGPLIDGLTRIAHRGAARLQRALLLQSSGGGGGHAHHHH